MTETKVTFPISIIGKVLGVLVDVRTELLLSENARESIEIIESLNHAIDLIRQAGKTHD